MATQTGNLPTNPFDNAFEMLGRVPQVITEDVNADALEELTKALTSRARERGRMILLRSPRAGFGKTHLLMRLHQRVAHTHEFIPLEPIKGKELDAQSVLDAVLRRFSRILPAGGGLTVLDLLARRILASGLEPLVKSGEVPSQDRESALQALQTRPVETFDFHNEEAVTAQWASANFSLLGPRLTAELAERTRAGFRPVAWWVELLFRYSSAPVDQTTRNSSLFETVFSGDLVETDMHEKLVALLNLTGLVTSPVLILDEVEGFSSNPEAALQVTTFLNALHQSCERLALIISVNGDVWETAFLPRIPCGLKDRLSDIVIDLRPMPKEVAMNMLRDRAGDVADSIAEELDFDSGVVYARGVVRCAANVWPEVVVYDDAAEDGVPAVAAEPISLSAQESIEQAEPEVAELRHDLHPPEVVIEDEPGPEPEPIVFEPAAESWESAEPEMPVLEPSLSESVSTDPTEGFLPESVEVPAQQDEPVQLSPQPEVPDLSNLPQPFARSENPEPESGTADGVSSSPFMPAEQTSDEGAGGQSQTESVEPSPGFAPQQVVDSPFSIDTSVPAQSPFRSVEAGSQDGSESQVQPGISEQTEVDDSTPPAIGSQDFVGTSPHSVTDDDHEKVEDLLKQFRERYGRD